LQYSDGTNFSDGTGFALPGYDEPTVSANGSAGASAIQLDGYIGRNLSVGSFFSINDFLYRVEANVDGAVTFNPPLREAVTVGQAVDVSVPKIRVRLRDNDGWRVFQNYGFYSSAMTFSVVEAFER